MEIKILVTNWISQNDPNSTHFTRHIQVGLLTKRRQFSDSTMSDSRGGVGRYYQAVLSRSEKTKGPVLTKVEGGCL